MAQAADELTRTLDELRATLERTASEARRPERRVDLRLHEGAAELIYELAETRTAAAASGGGSRESTRSTCREASAGSSSEALFSFRRGSSADDAGDGSSSRLERWESFHGSPGHVTRRSLPAPSESVSLDAHADGSRRRSIGSMEKLSRKLTTNLPIPSTPRFSLSRSASSATGLTRSSSTIRADSLRGGGTSTPLLSSTMSKDFERFA
jgi:hypothetical protein